MLHVCPESRTTAATLCRRRLQTTFLLVRGFWFDVREQSTGAVWSAQQRTIRNSFRNLLSNTPSGQNCISMEGERKELIHSRFIGLRVRCRKLDPIRPYSSSELDSREFFFLSAQSKHTRFACPELFIRSKGIPGISLPRTPFNLLYWMDSRSSNSERFFVYLRDSRCKHECGVTG